MYLTFEAMLVSPDLIACAVLLLFILIQLFYFLFFFSRLAFYRKSALPDEAPQIPVSIIVCAFNEEANLKKNLPLLLQQDYHRNQKPYFEVVVVNDNSEDDTYYLLMEMQKKYPHLHVVNLTQDAKLIPGKKFPLSMGIKSAHCDHVLLTDADCRPASKHWLRRMSASFSGTKKIVLGFSPYSVAPGWLNKKIRFEATHGAIQYLSFALAGVPYMGVGRNLAYHKELFQQSKGFSSHHHIMSGDDDLFINQVATTENTAICVHPEAFTWSDPKKSNEEWHFQKKRHLSTGKYYRRKHQVLLAMYNGSHFLSWMALIPCILFPQWILVSLSAWVLRWLLQWFFFQRCFSLLKQKDLINYIWVFDFWLLGYHLRSIPSILFKQKVHWK